MRIRAKRVWLAAGVAAAGLLAFTAATLPANATTTTDGPQRLGPQVAANVVGPDDSLQLLWDACFTNTGKVFTLYWYLEPRQPNNNTCGKGAYGFAAISQTSGTSGHVVEVCDYVGPSFTMVILASDGQQIPYTDPIGGGCYKAPKGYGMQEFKAKFPGEPDSPWQNA